MSSTPRDVASQESDYDPVFLHSRREAIAIFCVWAVCLMWTVPYCYWNGYPRAGEEFTLTTVWGIPSWAFWGVLCPWILANLFTAWFCFFSMEDDDLGAAHEGADIEEEIEERHTARKEASQ